MAFIYIITNQINGKQYVGKTTTTIQERFAYHKYDMKGKFKENVLFIELWKSMVLKISLLKN